MINVKRFSLRALAWSLIGIASIGLQQWIIIILIARLGTIDQVGVYTTALAVAIPLSILFSLGFRQILAADPQKKYALSSAVRYHYACFLPVMLLSAAIAYLLDTSIVIVTVVVGLVRYLEAHIEIYYGALQRELHYITLARSQFLRSLSVSVMFGAAFFVVRDLSIALLVTVPILLSLIIISRRQMSRDTSAEAQDTSRSLLKVGIPTSIAFALVSFIPAVPRLFLPHYATFTEIGIFGAVSHLIVVGTVLMNAVVMQLTPVLAQHVTTKNHEAFIRIVLVTASAVVLGAFALFMLPTSVVNLALYALYEIAPQPTVLFTATIFTAAAALLASLGTTMLVSLAAAKEQVVINVTAITVAGLTSAIAIPSYGIVGAMAVWGIAAMVQIIGATVVVLRWCLTDTKRP